MSQLAFEKFELERAQTEPTVPTVAAIFDLRLHIHPEPGFLRVEVISSTDLYASMTMENSMQDWHAVLERGLSGLDAAIKSLGPVSLAGARCFDRVAQNQEFDFS